MGWDAHPWLALDRDQQEARRLAAADDLEDGELSQAEIAEKYGVTEGAVSQWAKTLKEEGREGLRSTTPDGNQGPDPKLGEADKQRLAELLEEGPQAHGWETDLWTRRRVAQLIEDAFGVTYHPRHCSRILHDIGYRPVKPKREAREKDPAEKQRWLREEAEELKKT